MPYTVSPSLVLGTRLNERVPEVDQRRQRAEVNEILRRLCTQPGVILADEVGMGKTYVALAAAFSVASSSPQGPVIVMVPANLVGKWEQDLKTFCELYVEGRHPIRRDGPVSRELRAAGALRYAVARNSVDLMRLLDDPPRERSHLIFLAQGALTRRQSDKWVRLALISEALRRHATGRGRRLIQVKMQIHRFLAKLLRAVGEESAHDWGPELWGHLLRTSPQSWKAIYNDAVPDVSRHLDDDPVPKAVARALNRIDLRPLADVLEQMPIRERGGGERVSERIAQVRKSVQAVEPRLWAEVLREARWRSPLLVMDEAHHLKNPQTMLAQQLQSPDSKADLRLGDGAMANAFDRMLFLTATPFQLGHNELVKVLERFGDVRWNDDELGTVDRFKEQLISLGGCLDDSQRTAIALQRAWSRLRLEDCPDPTKVETWWNSVCTEAADARTYHQRAVVEAVEIAQRCRTAAQVALRPWIVRHDKGSHWPRTNVLRRERLDGAAISDPNVSGGLSVPPSQRLPFFLAARSAVRPGQDLLGEALSSSYEAFRDTRRNRTATLDEQEAVPDVLVELSLSRWYLQEFDRALRRCSGSVHPKIAATVARVIDLWEEGEKVLVFAFYRHTCRALRVHISTELERRIAARARRGLPKGKSRLTEAGTARLVDRVQRRYFDDTDSPGRRAVDASLRGIIEGQRVELNLAGVTPDQEAELIDVMRRFLRVPTTLVRCFPLAQLETIDPAVAVRKTLDSVDGSDMAWRRKLQEFVRFLCKDCSTEERRLYLDAASRTQTGSIRVEAGEGHADDTTATLANVQEATGGTRRDARERLMRAFNTPFFPDILVCSEVMGEGVDLQRSCRHVIHHDLAWNPSTIEQRTGRIDRLGCKAELGQLPIRVYLPYLAGTADERQYQVMSERERWFRIVMGQEEVAKLIAPENSSLVPLPLAISERLGFNLALPGFGN